VCGIVGLIDTNARVDPRCLGEATTSLHTRGPDGEGTWLEGGVGLGHRRLAVLDTTQAASQPMVSGDGRFVIVFNGEIYNFMQLRHQLDESVAGNWHSRSDTEVILASYAKWGVECLQYFHGMFAFAIWDRHDKVLFAARDRMGEKPFYYHISPAQIAFASRPRALFSIKPGISAEVDEQALRFYVGLGYIPAPWSYHRAIRKLPPAHYLLWQDGRLEVHRYWDFRSIEPDPSWRARSEDDLLDELDEILGRCVRSRLVSDVPLGAFLSGGIDSSLVVAMMAKHSTAPVKTFTIGFEETAFDESAHAQAVATHLGTEHHCERLKVDDLLGLMPTFAKEYDEPFFDYSAFPTMAVSRLARRHVTVSLTGDGGDELFGGYHYYRIAEQMSAVFRLPDPLRKAASALVGMLPSHRAKLLGAALRQTDTAAAFAFIRSISKDFGGVLRPDLLSRTTSISELFSQTVAALPHNLSVSEQGMRLDSCYTLPDDYLQKVDVASMAFSLESRAPLLDQHLVEWGMKLPVEWKLRGKTNKYLLRRLAYRYIPRALLDRPKQGFSAPIDVWLRGPLRKWAEERCNETKLFADLPLEQSRVSELMRLHVRGTRDVHPLLWAILVLLQHASASRSPA
jgi:asparagine synthase (glutamine-hydrolysing)